MSTTEGTGHPASVPAIPLAQASPETTTAEATATAPEAPAPPATPPSGMQFVGDRGAYWRLLIRGGALLADSPAVVCPNPPGSPPLAVRTTLIPGASA